MRKALLAPWHPEVETIPRWFLAKAQVKTGAAIHAAHDVINHHDTRVTTTAENLPEFLPRTSVRPERADKSTWSIDADGGCRSGGRVKTHVR